MTEKREYVGIQALRAVAASIVVVHHATQLWQQRLTSMPDATFWVAGATGVDVFFVISGFVMMLTSQQMSGARGARAFLLRRLIRIVPLYWLITGVKAVALLKAPAIAFNPIPSSLSIAKSFFFIPSMFAGGRIGVVLVVGWTLIFEMFFYLVFSIGIWTKVNRLRFLSIAMGLVAIIGLFPKGSWAVALYVADPIVLEFLAGAWIAEIMVKRGRVFPPGVAVAMAAAWCVYMAHFPQNGIGPLRMLTAGLPAILLVAAVISLENVLHFRIPRWLRTLGDGSYSIYLIHGLILPVIGFLMVKGGFLDRRAAEPLTICLSLISSSLAGILVYRILELPVTEWLKKKVKPRDRRVALAAHPD